MEQMENVDTKNSNNVISLDDKRKKKDEMKRILKNQKELPTPHETSIISWVGEKGRRVDFYDPCPCGCTTRNHPNVLGYLSGSNDEGEGFTIMVSDQETYKRIRNVYPNTVKNSNSREW